MPEPNDSVLVAEQNGWSAISLNSQDRATFRMSALALPYIQSAVALVGTRSSQCLEAAALLAAWTRQAYRYHGATL